MTRAFCSALLAGVLALTSAASHAQESTAPPSETVKLGNLLAPKAFRAAMDRVLPTMVTIESFGGVSGGKRGQMQGIRLPGEGPTTGVIISSDGYIVTSTFNFLKKPPIITVVLPNGERKVAKLLGQDETRKICVLKVDGVEGLPVPQFAPRSQLRVGQWAIALGVGFGDEEASLSAGIISATSRISARAVQTDANLSPANYGGPLVDLDGRVIGICVPLSPQSKEVAAGVEWYDSGIGFAVPMHGAEELLAKLKAGETIKQGFLGIKHQATPDQKPGSMVTDVVKGTPADKAGFKKDDRIIAVAGEEVLDHTHLMSLMGKRIAGEEVTFTVKRGEETLELVAKLEAQLQPPPMPMNKATPMPDNPGDDKQTEPKQPDKPAEDKPAEGEPENAPADEG